MDHFDSDNASVLLKSGHVAVTLQSGHILVWGGYCDTNTGSRYCPPKFFWLYDPQLEAWNAHETEGEVPPGISGAGAVVIDNKLFVVGGYCEDRDAYTTNGNSNHIFSLDLSSKIWSCLTIDGQKPLPSDKFAIWNHKEKIFIFGGFGLNPFKSASYNAQNVDFVPDDYSQSELPRGWNNQFAIFDTVTNRWSWPKDKGSRPIPRAAHACAKLEDRVYICGGRHRNIRMNDVHCFNLTTMSWSGILPIPEPVPTGRSWHSLNPISKTKLVLYGGLGHNQESLNDCWILETNGLFWYQLQRSSLQPRLWHTANFSSDGELIILGGCINNIQMHIAEYASEILKISISPKSLLRLSLDAVVTYRVLSWEILPQELKNMFMIKYINKWKDDDVGNSFQH